MPKGRNTLLLSGLVSAAVIVTAAVQAHGQAHGQVPVEPSISEPGSAEAAAAAVPSISTKLPPGMPKGYLQLGQLPDSLALLPPPPAAGSAAFARDEEASKAMARPAGSPRFVQAASDADLKPPHSFGAFACAAGVTPDAKLTPALYRVLGKAMIDIGLSTYKAKDHYRRVRPFVAHGNATCSPQDEAVLRTDGSYPSGHSALGWGWALILAELLPDRADAVLQRGRDFGDSRLVCNVHWASDVDAGRLMASATLARLHADRTFRADLDAARAELAKIGASRAPAEAACRKESMGLLLR
ncbi:phosphatase PAP2 family protein [Novosphingobium sp.]|uniref:acid phosphatase n=1 Tax=Novosphingobium sp. TaxID=1874826 RepID=UPI0028AD2BAC|nr:phosphatase PAP2 family protein [Novosphingobium sp.]